MDILEEFRTWRDEWQKVYRFNGGWKTELECLVGAWRVKQGKNKTISQVGQLDAVTFSVVPKMTAVWANFSLRIARQVPMRILIADSAGSLPQVLPQQPGMQIFPVFNYHHAHKLDMFVYQVCKAPYVLVSDDDIFWLGSEAIRWALEQFEDNPNLAVVSLLPKNETPDLLKDKVQQPMGSLFMLRRSIWLKEKLSFAVDKSPLKLGLWIYDTGEKAQTQLLERGYDIVYLPEPLRQDFVALKGISTWVLKAQKHRGNLRSHIQEHVGLQEKVFQMLVSARRLGAMFSKIYPQYPDANLTHPIFLDKVEHLCRELLDVETMNAIESEINQKMDTLSAVLFSGEN
jgi:hypothetical protein